MFKWQIAIDRHSPSLLTHLIFRALPHIWLCNRSHLNFLIYEENFVFFVISVLSLSSLCQ